MYNSWSMSHPIESSNSDGQPVNPDRIEATQVETRNSRAQHFDIVSLAALGFIAHSNHRIVAALQDRREMLFTEIQRLQDGIDEVDGAIPVYESRAKDGKV